MKKLSTKKFSIPTKYNGTVFRSKLEANWAEFFDRHGIIWVYEPEGYDFGGLRVLPDFYLPELNILFEVKGILDSLDFKKLASVARAAAKHGVWIIVGEAPAGQKFRAMEPNPMNPGELVPPRLLPPDHVELVRCFWCHKWTFQYAASRCFVCGHTSGLIHPHIGSPRKSDPCPDCGGEYTDSATQELKMERQVHKG